MLAYPPQAAPIDLDGLALILGMKRGPGGAPGMSVADHIGVAVGLALSPQIRTATRYLSTRYSVKATRRHRRPGSRTEIVVSIGRPNYAERRFIKACLKSGEPFPVRKTQLKFWPAKKRARGK